VNIKGDVDIEFFERQLQHLQIKSRLVFVAWSINNSIGRDHIRDKSVEKSAVVGAIAKLLYAEMLG